MTLDRRHFLKTATIAGAALTIPGAVRSAFLPARANLEPLEFVFFTDTHIQPELNAGQGCEMCFAKIAASQPEFAIMGGDHVFDALGVGGTRANLVFDLYARTQKMLGMPLYQAIGNHDAFGVLTSSGIAPTDPLYGKKMYEDRFGKSYYSFDRKGYHFVVLDSIQPTPDRLWEARIDDAQLDWLRADLKSLPSGVPVIGVVHCPLVTAFGTYAQIVAAGQKYNTLTVANSPDVLDIFSGANVLGVLQGHTHINEEVDYKGTRYITSGAVCGNWWRGPRLGTPEGYSVVSVRDGKLSVRYETYGFQSVALSTKTASPSSMRAIAPATAPAPTPATAPAPK
ncbi:MAG: calcineurin-like phosphoesterase C-terminal domain-containing protein [Candidatus Acidiferrales bacterium]